jgi:hypothetical protein
MVRVCARTRRAVLGQAVRQDQGGQHQEEVGEPQQRRRHPAAEVRGGDADEGADHDRQQRGGEPDEQRDAAAPDRHEQHRPAEVVGAEPELAGRRAERAAGRLGDVEAALVADERQQERDDHRGGEQDEPGQRGFLRGEVVPGPDDGRAAAAPRDPARRRRRFRGGHEVRTLGSSTR